MDELTAWLTLNRAPALERSSFHALRQHFAGVADIVAASARALRAAGASKGLVDWLASPPRESIDADRRWLDCESHHFICLESPDYPPLLGRLDDAPLGLFVRGSPSWLAMPQLAMVGARHPTPPGAETAYDFAAHLARCGLTVTSGLAIGIDAASHRGALSGGATIAVCGTGLDVNYPRSHAALAAQITQCGALVSEFGTGTLPMKGNFPRRNRVIAGLSLGTLVVEAAVRSGSLITARLAAEQGREVFAIPGSIHNPMSRGCHRLIREGAKLVETADDIFEELRPLSDSLQCLAQTPVTPERSQLPGIPARSEASGPRLDKGYEILLDALGFEPAGVDLLVVRTGLRADEVASMLLILELDGHILPYPGGLYVRAHPRQ
jgi:DNA processing protein